MVNLKISKILSLIIVTAAVTVIVGWVFNIDFLRGVIPGFIEMKFLTAVTFVLSGVLIFLLSKYRETFDQSYQLVATIFSGFIILLMSTFFVSSVFGIPIGLENIFVKDESSMIVTLFPGRPSIGTMLDFNLIAITGIILLQNVGYWYLGRILGWVISLVGISAIAGYVLKIPVLYFEFSSVSNSMAINTAVLFILAGFALIRLSQHDISMDFPAEKRSKINSIIGSLIIVILAGGLFLFVSLWGNYTASPVTLADKIIIGTETWPGYLPLYIAQDKGFFREAGLDVEIKRYISLENILNDYIAEKMQGRADTTLDAINETMRGVDHKIVLAIDYSDGADGIVASNKIKSVRDFRGLRVGFEPGTLEEFFLVWALRQNGLTLKDIVSVPGNPAESLYLLQAGKIDAAVSHEPFISQIINQADFHVVYSSHNAPELITDVLVFRTDFINTHPEAVQAVVAAYFKALKFLTEQPEESYRIAQSELGISNEDIIKQMKGIKMLSERDNEDVFTFAAGLESLYGNLKEVADFFISRNHLGDIKIPDTDAIIDPQFIHKITR